MSYAFEPRNCANILNKPMKPVAWIGQYVDPWIISDYHLTSKCCIASIVRAYATKPFWPDLFNDLTYSIKSCLNGMYS